MAAPTSETSYAGVNAGYPVAERVHAGEFGVSVSHVLEGHFAALKFLLEGSALRPADLDQVVLGILALLQHSTDSSLDFTHQLI